MSVSIGSRTFLHEHSIDRQTYERQRDLSREQLALAEMELTEATENQLDVEGLLAFAEHLLTNAARLWMERELDKKHQLQNKLVSRGLTVGWREILNRSNLI